MGKIGPPRRPGMGALPRRDESEALAGPINGSHRCHRPKQDLATLLGPTKTVAVYALRLVRRCASLA